MKNILIALYRNSAATTARGIFPAGDCPSGSRAAVIACLRLWVLVVALTAGAVSPALARDVTLQWNSNPEDDVAGYRVYYKAGEGDGPFECDDAAEGASPVDVGNVTSISLSGLGRGTSYSFAVTAYNTAGFESSLSDVVVAPEAVPPTVAFTGTESVLTGTATVKITAADNVGVARVELLVDETIIARRMSGPYSFAFETRGVTDGQHTLVARAVDAAGNVGTASRVVVVANAAPEVRIVSPRSGPLVVGSPAPRRSGTTSGGEPAVKVEVEASAAAGVASVELLVDGTVVAVRNNSPFTFTWNPGASPKLYVLSARATSKLGKVRESARVEVRTAGEAVPPAVAIISPAEGKKVAGVVSVRVTAVDISGIARVECYVDGTLLGSASKPPYTFRWDTAGFSPDRAHVLRVVAYDMFGNHSETTREVWVRDTRPPVVTMQPLVVEGNGVHMRASAADNASVTNLCLYIDKKLFLETAGESLDYVWDAAMARPGKHVITVMAADASGMTARRTVRWVR